MGSQSLFIIGSPTHIEILISKQRDHIQFLSKRPHTFKKNDTIAHTSTSQGLCCLTPLSTIFQLYLGGRFIGGGNRSTRKKPPTCRRSLTKFITLSSTPRLSRIRTHNFSGDIH